MESSRILKCLLALPVFFLAVGLSQMSIGCRERSSKEGSPNTHAEPASSLKDLRQTAAPKGDIDDQFLRVHLGIGKGGDNALFLVYGEKRFGGLEKVENGLSELLLTVAKPEILVVVYRGGLWTPRSKEMVEEIQKAREAKGRKTLFVDGSDTREGLDFPVIYMRDGKLESSNEPFDSVDDLVRDLARGGVREVLYAFPDKSPLWTELDQKLSSKGIRNLHATPAPSFKKEEFGPGEFVLPDEH